MSKIIEGLARKDSEFQLKSEEETKAYSSKKNKIKNGDRYIDVNINTNLRQYNSDSEGLQEVRGKNPNI